jgi:predicted negative regulator of RcsB-dependent stress response
VKGDVLRQKGDHAAARAAYADALQLTDVVDPRRELLEMKIDEVKS